MPNFLPLPLLGLTEFIENLPGEETPSSQIHNLPSNKYPIYIEKAKCTKVVREVLLM